MTTNTNQCNNCQLLEKKILDGNSNIKKLVNLKSKIFHTDTLIRKFKEQKDETLMLRTECDKAQSFCAKYEIDLKLALEELHSLRRAEKDLQEACSKYESEINSLTEHYEAEKALVKQYKCLVEKEDKAGDEVKEKLVKDLEKKLSKKDQDLQESKDINRVKTRKLSLVSKSHVKALKLLQKLGAIPAFQQKLTPGDKKSISHFEKILQKQEELDNAVNQNQSDDDEVSFEDESQRLESLLMDTDSNENSQDLMTLQQVPVDSTNKNQLSHVLKDSTEVNLESESANTKEGISTEDNYKVSQVSEGILTPRLDINMCSSVPEEENLNLNDMNTAIEPITQGDTSEAPDSFYDTGSLAVNNSEYEEIVQHNSGSNCAEIQENVTVSEVLTVAVSDSAASKPNDNLSGVEQDHNYYNTNNECCAQGINIFSDLPDEVKSKAQPDKPSESEYSLPEKQQTEPEKIQVPSNIEGNFDIEPARKTFANEGANLFKDISEVESDIFSSSKPASTLKTKELTFLPPSGEIRKTKDRKLKASLKQVAKIQARMNYTSLLECPVSPLPPSPPPSPQIMSADSIFQMDDPNTSSGSKPKQPIISELFGSDSEGEIPKQKGKGVLQHQESEGFELDPEEVEEQPHFRSHSNGVELIETCSPSPSNSRLFTDFTIDRNSGRCKLSIRLPDSLNPVSNVRLELDTLTRELHLDYGHTPFREKEFSGQFSSNRLSENPHQINNTNKGCRSEQPNLSSKKHSPRGCSNELTSKSDSHNAKSSTSCNIKPAPISSKEKGRRITVPQVGNALHRFALEKKAKLSQNQDINRTSVPNQDVIRPSAQNQDFSRPSAQNQDVIRSRVQNQDVNRTCVQNHGFNRSNVEHNSELPANKPKRVQHEVPKPHKNPLLKPSSCLTQSTFEPVIEQENTSVDSVVPSFSSESNKFKNPVSALVQESHIQRNINSNHLNLSIAPSCNSDNSKPTTKQKGQKRKFEESQNVSPCIPEPGININPLKLFPAIPSDSDILQIAKMFHNAFQLQIKPSSAITKCLKNLKFLNGDDENDKLVFFNMAADFCNPNLISSPEELIGSSLHYFLNCNIDFMTNNPKGRTVLPPLTFKEECFISLIKRLQERKQTMKNLFTKFRAAILNQLFTTSSYDATGYGSLCRLFTGFCRMEGNVQAPRALCFNLMLKKHSLCVFLVANIGHAWTQVLDFSKLYDQREMVRKVYSYILLGKNIKESRQFQLAMQTIMDISQLEPPEEGTGPNSLAEDALKQLSSEKRFSGCEELCQLLLLLSSREGWDWTKATLLRPLFDLLASGQACIKISCVRLIGNLLHFCIPVIKDEICAVLVKLENIFMSLDDNDFNLKEACLYSLLHQIDCLDASTVSHMKQWVLNHNTKFSSPLQEDISLSGLLH